MGVLNLYIAKKSTWDSAIRWIVWWGREVHIYRIEWLGCVAKMRFLD